MYKNKRKNTGISGLIITRIFDVFCSVKPAIIALLFVGLISIAGVLVPQNADTEEYTRLYGDVISLILLETGLTNVFSSWWFILPVAYLMVSMTVCSVKRLPDILKITKQNSLLFERDDYEKSQYHRYFTLPCKNGLTVEDVRNKLDKVFQRNRYRTANRLSQDDALYVAYQKGYAGLFGPFFVHISLIIIAAGAVWTATKSYSHLLRIAVGESLQVPDTQYSVKLHDFKVEYYEGTDRPREYKSILSVFENSHLLGDGELTVNKPLTVAGIGFYQMTYNPNVSDVTITVTRQKDNKSLGEFKIPVGQETYIEKLGLSIKPVDLLPDFALTSDGVAVSRTAIFKNPAVLLDISPANKKMVSKWVFQIPSEFHRTEVEGYIYGLKDFTVRTVSGIKIIRDRAIPLVYIGFFLLTAGTFLSCYIFYRCIWIKIISSPGQIELWVAGKCNRNILDFQMEIGKCVGQTGLLDKEVLL